MNSHGEKRTATVMKAMKVEDAVEAVMKKPTIPIWPHTAILLDLSRGAAYEAAKRGEIETVRYGKSIKAVSASLRRRLKLDAE